MSATAPNVTRISNPLVAGKLLRMRQDEARCPQVEFTRLMRELGMHFAHEVANVLPLREETHVHLLRDKPRKSTGTASVVRTEQLVLVPVLRSGLFLSDGFREILPARFLGHIGIHVDKKTRELTDYLIVLPEGEEDARVVVILDPVIATGGTAIRAVECVKLMSPVPERIIFVCVVASREGSAALLEAHPDVQVFCAAADDTVDAKGRVQPGLGSISGRIFGFLTEGSKKA